MKFATKKNLTNTVLQNKSFLIDVHCNNGEGISSSHQQNTQNSAENDSVSQQQQLQQQKERELQSKLRLPVIWMNRFSWRDLTRDFFAISEQIQNQN